MTVTCDAIGHGFVADGGSAAGAVDAVALRPEKITVGPSGGDGLPGTVTLVLFSGHSIRVGIDVRGFNLEAVLPRDGSWSDSLAPGAEVRVGWRTARPLPSRPALPDERHRNACADAGARNRCIQHVPSGRRSAPFRPRRRRLACSRPKAGGCSISPAVRRRPRSATDIRPTAPPSTPSWPPASYTPVRALPSPFRAALYEALTARLPTGLDVVHLANAGTEATEIALKASQFATGRHRFVCFEGGYTVVRPAPVGHRRPSHPRALRAARRTGRRVALSRARRGFRRGRCGAHLLSDRLAAADATAIPWRP